ncbi:hypothetical protein GCM10009682_04770 [Luedemannella flava]|uniref:Uncharacterized protein n=1 Tax=Luedemannella flava TaxID=349316 RepID=A0ABP4XNJ7_9ACTN
MSDVQEDPSANTARFQAFVNEAPEPESEKRGLPIALIATVAVAAVAVVAAIAFLATR